MQFIHKISKTFDFIAITEYFDESLILLGEILCWPLEQLAYFSINQRHDAKTKNEQSNLEALKNYGNNHWNRYDFLFYQHMNKTFWQQAEEYRLFETAVFISSNESDIFLISETRCKALNA